MTTPHDIPPVLLGPDSGRKIAEHLAAPDPRDEAVGLLRTILKRLDLEPKGAIFPCSAMRDDIRALLARIDRA